MNGAMIPMFEEELPRLDREVWQRTGGISTEIGNVARQLDALSERIEEYAPDTAERLSELADEVSGSGERFEEEADPEEIEELLRSGEL